MKALKILVIITAMFVLNSCSNDKVETSNGNVEFDNKLYNLNYGYLEKLKLNQGTQILLHLSDKEIKFINGDWELTKPRDTYINFILYYQNSNLEDISDFYPMSYGYEDIGINDDISFMVNSSTTFDITPSMDPNLDLEFEYRNFLWDDGSLTIDANDNQFEINFSLKKGDQIIKGEYKGKLLDVDNSSN